MIKVVVWSPPPPKAIPDAAEGRFSDGGNFFSSNAHGQHGRQRSSCTCFFSTSICLSALVMAQWVALVLFCFGLKCKLSTLPYMTHPCVPLMSGFKPSFRPRHIFSCVPGTGPLHPLAGPFSFYCLLIFFLLFVFLRLVLLIRLIRVIIRINS